jgi:hypothetical protein
MLGTDPQGLPILTFVYRLAKAPECKHTRRTRCIAPSNLNGKGETMDASLILKTLFFILFVGILAIRLFFGLKVRRAGQNS